MNSLIFVAEIIVAFTLIMIIMIQARGAGGLGGIFGGSESSGYRTRRGIEQLLFRFTIILGVIFVLISAISAHLGA
jgi:preprotein translocase subunit SecG